MEGAYYLILQMIVAEGVISILATCRYLLWTRRRARRGLIDIGLLVAQVLLFILCMPTLGYDVIRFWQGIEDAMLKFAVILPLTAAFLAHIAVFIGMNVRSLPEDLA